jgi:CubicO group peptidase (beta-lactamase class C family)
VTGAHEAMAERVARGELPGLVAVVADAETERVDAIGSTAFGGSLPMRRDTPFRITSMTKPMVATVAMMLVDDGTIAITDPVERYLPELAGQRVLARIDGPVDETVPAERSVTVEDLLTFRMGYGHILEPTFEPPYPITRAARELRLTMAEPDPRTPHPPDEWIRLFGSLPLLDQPGARWRYNVGSLVLGVLLARAAGRPLADLMRERLFGPLGMTATGFWLPAELAGRLPAFYLTDPETGDLTEQQLSTPDEWSRPPAFPSGSAGLASTADDLLAFARLLLNRGVHAGARLLSEDAVAAMTTNHLTPEEIAGGGFILSGLGWGYGMAVADTGRYGWDGGYGTFWRNDPATGRIGILLTQVSDVLFNGTADEFARLALTA